MVLKYHKYLMRGAVRSACQSTGENVIHVQHGGRGFAGGRQVSSNTRAGDERGSVDAGERSREVGSFQNSQRNQHFKPSETYC